MFFTAALLMWAADPVLRSPEDRLPIGAVARIGEARFARPVRANESIEFSPDGTKFVFLNSGTGANKVPDEWWDAQTLKRIVPPFRLKPDERMTSVTAAGIVCMSDRAYTLRDPATGMARFTLNRGEDQPYFYSPFFATGGDLAVALTNNREALLFRKNKDGTAIGTTIKEISSGLNLFRVAANGSAIVWSTEEEIKRYDTTTGRISTVRKLEEPFIVVNTLDISPDGRTIVMVLRDRNYDQPPLGLLYVGDVPQPITIADPKKGADQINYNRLQFSADGRTVFSLSYRACCGWSSATGEWLWSYTAGSISESALSPDGRRLVHQEEDGTFRLVDVISGTELTPKVDRLPSLHLAAWIDATTAVAMAAGSSAPSAGEKPGARLRWNAWSTAKPTVTPFAESGGWSAESLSNDGRLIGLVRRTSSSNSFYRVLDAASGKTMGEWENPSSDAGFVGPFSADGGKVVLRKERQTGLFTVAQQRPLVTFSAVRASSPRRRSSDESWAGRQMIISPDERLLFTPLSDNGIGAFELATGQLRYSISILGADSRRGDGTRYVAMACSADGRRLAIELYGQLMLVDPTTGRFERTMDLNTRRRTSDYSPIAISPDGRWYATVRPDVMDIALFDLDAEGAIVQRLFRGATGSIQSLNFSPDGRALLSTSSDGTAVTWDLRSLPRGPRTAAGNVDAWWDDLSRDASLANGAMLGLAAREPVRAVAMLRSQWQPAAVVDPERITKAVLDLDANDFLTREEARRRLAEMNEQAEPWLIKAAKTARSAEVRMTARALLDDLEGPDRDANRIRWRRAIEVLERINSSDSKSLLQTIAAGPPLLRTTVEATAALKRMDRVNRP